MAKHIVVLGAGRVGRAMAEEMAERHHVTLTDIHQNALDRAVQRNPYLSTQIADVTDRSALQQAVSDADLVISAVPGELGFKTAAAVVDAGKPLVDISFFAENAFELDQQAKAANIPAVVDCGVAPGFSNLLLGYYDERMTVNRFTCLVGGLPKSAKPPFYYKAPFSPSDVIEEYIRPVRCRENGSDVTLEALSGYEHVYFDKVGTVEAFNTDGLRTLMHTMPHIPEMKEKTLRYPGHAEAIRTLKSGGFLGEQPLPVKPDIHISPLEMTTQLLTRAWQMEEDEEEFTVLRAIIHGRDNDGNERSITYDLYDEYNPATATSSMARTTGYTATAVADLILDGQLTSTGIIPPEYIGRDETCFDYITGQLKKHGIEIKVSST